MGFLSFLSRPFFFLPGYVEAVGTVGAPAPVGDGIPSKRHDRIGGIDRRRVRTMNHGIGARKHHHTIRPLVMNPHENLAKVVPLFLAHRNSRAQ